MKLSVVVPYFNVEHYIRDCLASIAAQQMKDFEVILVDDGSQDGSREIAEQFVEKDPRFRILTQENQGLGPARNTGMRVAKGDFITFVDSDDIIPKGAFGLSIRRLANTGSDFVAGNARRFNNEGVRESWVHAGPMAEDRFRTHVSRHPDLANDRMVWNKVYRRSFWEEHGFEFPAIRYEDYPVTLRAHLLAKQVDVISEPVYLWRERDAGELSITQRVYDPPNVADRVTSALMVLDLLESTEGVTKAVRETVHQHFLDTDVGALVRAVALSVDTPDYDAVLAQAQQLVAALDPGAIANRARYERLRADLVVRGDGHALRHLVDIADGLEPPLAHVRRGGRRLIALQPDLAEADHGFDEIPDATRVLVEGDLHLMARVDSSTWHGDQLHLGLIAEIAYGGPVQNPSLRAWLRQSDGPAELPVEVLPTLAVDGHLVTAELRISGPAVLEASGDAYRSWVLHAELTTGDLTRSSQVLGVEQGAPPFGAAWAPEPSHWLVPGRSQGRYIVRSVAPRTVADRIRPGFRDEIAISGRSRHPLPLEGTELELSRRRHAFLVPVSVDPTDPTRWDTHVQLGSVADSEARDLFVPDVKAWLLHLVTPTTREAVLVSPDVPVARFGYDGREVQVSGGRFLGGHVFEGEPKFVLEEAVVDGTTMAFAGRWLGPHSASPTVALTWRHDLGEPEEVVVPATLTDGRLELVVDLAELSTRMAKVLDGAQSASTWWDFGLRLDGRTWIAHLSPDLVRRVPGPVATPHGQVRLTVHREQAARLTVSPA